MGGNDELTHGTPEPPVRALDVVRGWPVDAAAAGVLRLSRRAPQGAVVVDHTGDPTTEFAWASVTKLLVAVAVLVAVEEGTLALDDPAGPPGATIRHLLAHASGLGPDSRRPLTAPGRRRIYSNSGYEVLADTLATRAGMSFTDYVRTGVLDPLAMTGTTLPADTSPAWGARGPLRDLLALGGELLAPELLAPATLRAAGAVAFPGLSGVVPGLGRFDPCDWGLGVEVKDAKVPHWTGATNAPSTFGHFGRSGAFLWVDPEAALACGVLCDRPFGPWALEAWPALSDGVLEQWRAASEPEAPPGDGGPVA
jgi:CubicO group peptidase (beta-lactamase class C family)